MKKTTKKVAVTKSATKAKVEKKVAVASKNTPGKDIEERNAHGMIKIHENVIGDVVKEAVASLRKMVRLEEGSLIDNIAGLVGSSKGAIAIDMQENSVNVALKVNVIYGNNISTVATKIQNTIKNEIRNITGLTVNSVDVFVQKLIKEEEKDTKKEE